MQSYSSKDKTGNHSAAIAEAAAAFINSKIPELNVNIVNAYAELLEEKTATTYPHLSQSPTVRDFLELIKAENKSGALEEVMADSNRNLRFKEKIIQCIEAIEALADLHHSSHKVPERESRRYISTLVHNTKMFGHLHDIYDNSSLAIGRKCAHQTVREPIKTLIAGGDVIGVMALKAEKMAAPLLEVAAKVNKQSRTK